MTPRTREPSTALFLALVAVTLVGPLSIHLFLPALPLVRRAFAVDAGTAQLSFSLSMFAMALGTLIYGSLSDRLGRLPVLIGGLVLFTGGAAIAAIAPSITVLIIGRALQGLGAACGVVIARAVVSDVYGADRLGQMIAYLTAAYVIGPMASPPLGGLLGDVFGWQSILILPAVFGGFAIVIALTVIGETRQGAPRDSTGLLRGYRQLLGSLRFSLFTLHVGCTAGGFFALNAGASFLMVDALGRSATEFGLYFVLGAAGFMAGNFLAGRLSHLRPGNFFIAFGSVFSAVMAFMMIGLYAIFGLHPITLFVTSGLVSIGQGLSLPHAQAAAIATHPPLTGTASGIVVFAQFILAAALTQVVAAIYDGTMIPLMVIVIVTIVFGSACGLIATRLPASAPSAA